MKNRAVFDVLSDKLEELFPKGKCKERGQAMVLLAFFMSAYGIGIEKEREKMADILMGVIERLKEIKEANDS